MDIFLAKTSKVDNLLKSLNLVILRAKLDKEMLNMKLFTKTILIVALFLISTLEALAYEPQSCTTSPCDILAADYVEITQSNQSAVVSWSVLDNTQLQLGMTLNPKSGVFTWTPTNQQTGNFTIDIAGLDATNNSIVTISTC